MESNKLSFLNSLIYGSFWILFFIISFLFVKQIADTLLVIAVALRDLYDSDIIYIAVTLLYVISLISFVGFLATRITFYMIPKKFEKKDKKPNFIKDILLSFWNVIIAVAMFYIAKLFIDAEIFGSIQEHTKYFLYALFTIILSFSFISLSIRFYINKYVLK